MHSSQTYPSDLTDDEWKLLEPLLPKPKPTGRPVKQPRRAILNAIFYLNRPGCQWDMLPKDFPPKSQGVVLGCVIPAIQAFQKWRFYKHALANSAKESPARFLWPSRVRFPKKINAPIM